MADRREIGNAFEFVMVAGARARQLMKGCTPKTAGPQKLVRLAQKEVREGKVAKLAGPPADRPAAV
jgi:DNA-directed RNA polymerase subunit K/omega